MIFATKVIRIRLVRFQLLGWLALFSLGLLFFVSFALFLLASVDLTVCIVCVCFGRWMEVDGTWPDTNNNGRLAGRGQRDEKESTYVVLYPFELSRVELLVLIEPLDVVVDLLDRLIDLLAMSGGVGHLSL